MAIVLRGMTAEETGCADRRDGPLRRADGLSGPAAASPVDKHSTGGVGDKTSLILAPLAAACGALVPMMSGRGLGHTGGTLDKLEAIPGFRTGLSLDELRARASATIGCALIGQTSEIAPADRKLYALRDVTGTVESIPLISASIMSKKIAEGIGGLVLDVKTRRRRVHEDRGGRAARSPSRSSRSASASGVRTEALITRMDAPLGRAVGNALEVIESIETLKGRGPADLEAAVGAARGADADRGGHRARRHGRGEPRVRDGAALGRRASRSSARSSRTRGAIPRVVDDYARLPSAPDREPVPAPRAGVRRRRCTPSASAARPWGSARAASSSTTSIDPGVGIRGRSRPVGTQVRDGRAGR